MKKAIFSIFFLISLFLIPFKIDANFFKGLAKHDVKMAAFLFVGPVVVDCLRVYAQSCGEAGKEKRFSWKKESPWKDRCKQAVFSGLQTGTVLTFFYFALLRKSYEQIVAEFASKKGYKAILNLLETNN